MSHFSVFVIILIINTLISIIYLNFSLLYTAEQRLKYERASEEEKKSFLESDLDKKKTTILFLLMLLCPVVGPCFVGVSFLIRKIFYRKPVDLSDVMFSKERKRSRNPADVERESNMVPLEEALAVTDSRNLRTLMLNVIKGDDIGAYLRSISEALNSEDSETAHYAASVLRDELNGFRANVQEMYNELDTADKEETGKIGVKLLEYMNAFLVQHVFSPMEQRTYVRMMMDTAGAVFDRAPEKLKAKHFEWVCLRLLEVDEFARCDEWCDRGFATYPEELTSYTCMLKLYFKTEDQERFFDTLFALQQSNIVLDQEVLELIRTFT